MLAYNVNLQDVADAVAAVNVANGWADNLIVDPDNSEWWTNRGPRTRFRLRVRNSRAEPARLSQSGRHTVAASWEAHREVMRLLFAGKCTRIVSALADYRGAEDFEQKYRATYWHNAGSMMYPIAFGELTL